ncbi:ClpS-like protein [Wallemia mellicola]|uniref:ClpS-like protein n=1 Tax=Wallemia mellicola TaxID=1708541 RepID=A0AB74K9E1_9BASI|nr:ClpS-like protein [Wallemia mellicola]
MSLRLFSQRIISRTVVPSTSRTFVYSVRRLEESTNALPSNPKLEAIVDQIASLNLLEAADLASLLKTKLNIQDIAMPAVAAAPAVAAESAAEAEEDKPKEKTIFSVKLESIDATAKAKVIREVKALNPTMNLVEAKKFVESAPQIIKEGLSKEDAEKLQKTLEAAGAKIVLE